MNLGGEHLTAEDEHERLYGRREERPATMCSGEGHRYEKDADGWDVVVEVCKDCNRTDIGHWRARGLGEEWDL